MMEPQARKKGSKIKRSFKILLGQLEPRWGKPHNVLKQIETLLPWDHEGRGTTTKLHATAKRIPF